MLIIIFQLYSRCYGRYKKESNMILAFIQSFDNSASHWENNNETDPVIFGRQSESVMVLLQYWTLREYNTQDVNLECMCKG